MTPTDIVASPYPPRPSSCRRCCTRRFDPRMLDTMVLRGDGGTVLLFVWRERFDWGGSIPLDCPGLTGPLDTATLARHSIEPFRAGKVRFLWWERLDSMISEHKSFAYGQGLKHDSSFLRNQCSFRFAFPHSCGFMPSKQSDIPH